MKCPWKAANDIQRYVGSCILMYDGFPYHTSYVSITKVNLIKITELNRIDRVPLTVLWTDDKLDVLSPPLGYYNHEKEAYRLERQPYKQFAQGLTERNTVVYDMDDNRCHDMTIFCQGVEDMLTGKYPDFDEAWRLLEKQTSVAINIDVALQRGRKGFPTNVFYRGELVGFINPGSNKVIVPTTDRGWIISKYLDVFGWEIE